MDLCGKLMDIAFLYIPDKKTLNDISSNKIDTDVPQNKLFIMGHLLWLRAMLRKDQVLLVENIVQPKISEKMVMVEVNGDLWAIVVIMQSVIHTATLKATTLSKCKE
ncbi:hypothetical protein FQA39_LY08895 [Lamprigera yunnana]|nr:hypothetical protein FQA39_LY08895 [Lamprigera yunnana]